MLGPLGPAGPGGQHRSPVGIRTIDGETDAERIERLRRSYAEMGEEFNEAAVRASYIVDWELRAFGTTAGVEW